MTDAEKLSMLDALERSEAGYLRVLAAADVVTQHWRDAWARLKQFLETHEKADAAAKRRPWSSKRKAAVEEAWLEVRRARTLADMADANLEETQLGVAELEAQLEVMRATYARLAGPELN